LGCAALIGPNGSGKTTFLKTITGQLQPLSGTVKLGASLELGYFAQAHEQLHPKNRVIDELMRHYEMPVSQARNYLGNYMFRGDDVFQLVETLSGGERGRLALAILALAKANFLLLDEPTNHLDIPAQEMLQEVIENFDGTILLVTHDRYLVDHLATEIWQLEDGQLEVFKGDYQEFLAEREKMKERKRSENVSSRAVIKERSGSSRSNDYANRKRAQRLQEVENQIAEAEQLLAQITRRLQEAAEADAFDNIRGLSIEYAGVEEKLEALLKEWEELAHEQKMA
jgi:ATP-binding cassette subfamily F protein 3